MAQTKYTQRNIEKIQKLIKDSIDEGRRIEVDTPLKVCALALWRSSNG